MKGYLYGSVCTMAKAGLLANISLFVMLAVGIFVMGQMANIEGMREFQLLAQGFALLVYCFPLFITAGAIGLNALAGKLGGSAVIVTTRVVLIFAIVVLMWSKIENISEYLLVLPVVACFMGWQAGINLLYGSQR